MSARSLWLRLWDRWFGPWLSGKTTLGQRGERLAEKYLRRRGYLIIARGARDRRLGEIDLIAVQGRTVVFIEVKTRKSHDKGNPADAVDAVKQSRIAHLALRYLRRHDLLENAARFDIIAITWPDEKKPPTIEHFENAFEPPGKGRMFA